MAKLSLKKRMALGVLAMRRRLSGYVKAGLQMYHDYSRDALDKSPNRSNHGVMYTGRSLSFDGSNDYVNLDSFTVPKSQMTFSLWIKVDSTVSGGLYFLDHHNNTAGKRLILGWRGSGAPYFSIYSPGTGWQDFGAKANDGSWHRVVYTLNGTTAKCFVDNKQSGVDLTIDALDIPYTSTSVWNSNIGSAYDESGQFFNGEMSNVQIWDKAWTADDVAYDYANVQATPNDIATNSTALSVANCRTWLPMTEGNGTTLYDGGVVLGDELIDNGGFTGTIGEELVDNGTFDIDTSGWSAHTGFSPTVVNKAIQLSYTSGGNFYEGVYQAIDTVENNVYMLSFDVTATSGDTARIRIGDTSTNDAMLQASALAIGSYSYTFTANGTQAYINLSLNGATATVSFDNISVKDITEVSDNWTLGTGWSISDGTLGEELVENGTFDDPTYGSELVTNGTFDSDTSGWTPKHAQSVTVNNNQMTVVDNGDGNWGWAFQNVLEDGKVYKVIIDLESESSNAYFRITENSNSYPYNSNTHLSLGLNEFTITSGSAAKYVFIGGTGTSVFNSISVKEITSGGTSGWSTNTGTHSVVNGKLLTTSSSTSNELSETACVGFQGRTYTVTQDASNFTPASAVNGYIRLDGVYDSNNIISFTEENPSVTFVAYRDFTFIKYFAGSSNHSMVLDNISVKEVPHGWDESWVAGDNKAVANTVTGALTVDNVLTPNRDYLIEFDYTKEAGNIQFRPDGMAADTYIFPMSVGTGSTSLLVNSSTYDDLMFKQSGYFKGSIDNISVKEVQPKENGTITNGATWEAGVIGSEVETPFDGVNDYVTTGHHVMGDAITLSSWVKQETGGSSYQTVLSQYYSGNDVGSLSFFLGFDSTSTKPRFSAASNLNSPDALTEGWHLIVGTADATGHKLYVDGVLKASNNNGINSRSLTGALTSIGSRLNSDNTLYNQYLFKGDISQASIFDHALTATEVSELYALGKSGDATNHSQAIDEYVGDTELINTQGQSGTILNSPATTPWWSASGGNPSQFSIANDVITVNASGWEAIRYGTPVAGTTYQLTFDLDRTAGTIAPYYDDVTDIGLQWISASGSYSHTFTPGQAGFLLQWGTSDFVGTISNISVKEVKGDHLVGYWKNTGVQKWDDLSGNANHGTFKNHVFGNIPQTGLMSYNKPMLFDGTDDYVGSATPLEIALSGQSTHFGWFIPKSVAGTQAIYNTAKDGSNRIGFGLYNDAFKFSIYNGTAYTTHTVNTSIEADTLYSVACVIDNSVLSVYINGELTTNDGGGNIYTNFERLYIGSTHTNSADGNFHGFDGLINEVGSFDTALSADEVSELYNNGTPLDATTHSKVDNLQGYWRNDGDDVWVDRTPVLGAEIITNSGFDTDSDWEYSNGWSYDSTIKKAVRTDYPTNTWVRQQIPIVAGRTYQVEVDIEYTGGYEEDGALSHSDQTNTYIDTGSGHITVGNGFGTRHLSGTFTAVTTQDMYLQIYGIYDFVGTFDNISVKEVKGGNNGTVSGSPETILLPEARNNRDTLGFPINNVNNGYLALHGDGYVEVADDASLDFGTGDFTLEAWVKYGHVNQGSGWNVIMSNGNADSNSATGHGFNLMTNSVKFAFRTDGGANTIYSNAVGYTDDWYHLVVTRTAGLIEMFVDTVKQDQSMTYAGDISEEHILHIGTDGSATREYTQPIDEPRIYNRALTASEVLSNYNGSKSKHRNN